MISRTRQSSPASSKIARANSAQEHSPSAATCHVPCGSASSSRVASARWPTYVGEPTWSATTLTSSRSRPSSSIVLTKLRPFHPYSHELRTIQPSRTSRSPSSFVRPYTESGFGSSDSTYGSRFVPSKT